MPIRSNFYKIIFAHFFEVNNVLNNSITEKPAVLFAFARPPLHLHVPEVPKDSQQHQPHKNACLFSTHAQTNSTHIVAVRGVASFKAT